MDAVTGLFPGAAAMDDRYYNVEVATKVGVAVTRFNQYVDASGASFLDAPPPMFLALNALLGRVAAASIGPAPR